MESQAQTRRTARRSARHRKFFLSDGTVVAGTHEFYHKIRKVFDAARKNAPSVVFIDDADVMFAGDKDQGLQRFLLTMLDGLESASAERICVMMTAMDVGSLPQAMLRSGRVELWLETRVPDTVVREADPA
ncbi:MAG: ATP-binding protein [Bryobacteraceae bacterium]